MRNETYQDIIKNKTSFSHISKEAFESLKDIVEHSKKHQLKLFTEEEIITTFSADLKRLLEINDLEQLLQEFFQIENNLIQLDSFIGDKVRVPNFDEFYKNLSPGLIRSMWEYFLNPKEQEEVIHSWMESVRIALEEEFYLWQEKIMN